MVAVPRGAVYVALPRWLLILTGFSHCLRRCCSQAQLRSREQSAHNSARRPNKTSRLLNSEGMAAAYNSQPDYATILLPEVKSPVVFNQVFEPFRDQPDGAENRTRAKSPCKSRAIDDSPTILSFALDSGLADVANGSESQHPQTSARYDSAATTLSTHTNVSEEHADALASSENSARLARAPTGRITTIDGMRIFDQDVSRMVTDRFNEVSRQLEPALLSFLHKKRIDFRPLSIQLLVLGVSEGASKPWIVVLCPASARSKVKSFFKKDFAKNVCHTSHPCTINFDVVVMGRPLKPTGSKILDEVFTEQGTEAYEPWEAQIKVTSGDIPRFTTMGGFVCITDAYGIESIYGLTAGHIIPADDPYDEYAHNSYNDESDDSDNSEEDDHEDETNDLQEPTNTANVKTSLEVQVEAVPASSDDRDNRRWDSLGKISQVSYSGRARNRDWALIEPTEPRRMRRRNPEQFVCASHVEACFAGGHTAMLRNKSLESCTISKLPARAILPSGHEFVDVHVVQLCDCEVPLSGSSGSWIISRDHEGATQVYGALVASDTFGSLWMVPMVDLLDDVLTQFSDSSVALVNSVDDLEISQQSAIPQAHTTIATASKSETAQAVALTKGDPVPASPKHFEIRDGRPAMEECEEMAESLCQDCDSGSRSQALQSPIESKVLQLPHMKELSIVQEK
ncbi:hypothetical protein HBI47_074690 [Parastagonospora nodorum]|nr:hypothetical protein HBI47_074690 [Parastagonospora nodorum]